MSGANSSHLPQCRYDCKWKAECLRKMAEDQQVLKVVTTASDAVLSLQVLGSDADVGYADSVD